MKFNYSSPLSEEIHIYSGAPLCGSTGERFNDSDPYDGIDDWSKHA